MFLLQNWAKLVSLLSDLLALLNVHTLQENVINSCQLVQTINLRLQIEKFSYIAKLLATLCPHLRPYEGFIVPNRCAWPRYIGYFLTFPSWPMEEELQMWLVAV